MNDLIKFISPIRQLRLVIAASQPAVNIPGVGQTAAVKGKYVEFDAGFYKTNDPEIISWLENHAEYGIKFWRVDDNLIVKDVASTLTSQLGTGKTLNQVINTLSAEELKKLSLLLDEKAASKEEEKNKDIKKEVIQELELDDLKKKIAALEEEKQLKATAESLKEDNYITSDVPKKGSKSAKSAAKKG